MFAIMVPVLTLVIAELVWLRPLRTRANDATREATAKGLPSAWQLQLAAVQADVQKVKDEITAVRAQMDASQGKLDHGAALKEVSKLCEEHGLALVSSAQENLTVHQELQAAVPLISERNGGVAPEAWRIDVRGGYTQVKKLLTALSTSKAWIVPLQLGMKMDEEGQTPTTWALTLWL